MTLLLALTLVGPVAAQAPARVSGAVSGLFTIAPTLEYDGDADSGNYLSLSGELALDSRWVGRMQFDLLNAGSVEGASFGTVESGWAVIGSLGYRLHLGASDKFTLDLLGSGGMAAITITGVNTTSDASPQFGFTIAPHWQVTEKLAATFSFRVLQGAEVGMGSAINRTDVGVGLRMRLF
jgi:hypothetical protein